jgi:hypothetical protein
VLLLAALLALLGCGRMPSREPPAGPPALAAVTTMGAGGPGGDLPAADRAMRVTVETTLVVPRRDAAVATLRALVRAAGGYVSEGTLYGPDEGGSATYTVKVPAAGLTDFRWKVAALGEVRSDSEKAEDVTEARADLRARLHNARAQEQRLLDLLTNRTGSLGDVVAVEKEMGSVRETIERLEAEERTLEGQVAFATVKVQLQTVHVQVSEGAGRRLVEAAKDGVDNARGFLLGTLAFTLAAGPTLVIIGVGLYLLFVVLRGLRRRRKAAPPPG